MGVENNECVIAITWNKAAITSVKNWVKTLSEEKQSLFVFVPALTNGKETVFLAPDGSKKGWATANSIAELRVEFIKLIESLEDFQWVEVGFGEFGQKVLQGNNSNCYSDADMREPNVEHNGGTPKPRQCETLAPSACCDLL